MECRSTSLQLLKREVDTALARVSRCYLVHVKRDWNGAADRFTTLAMQQEAGSEAPDASTVDELQKLNRLNEILLPEEDLDPAGEATVAVTTRIQSRQREDSGSEAPCPARTSQGETSTIGVRLERIRIAQDEEKWIADLKKFLGGQLTTLTREESKACAKIADNFQVGADGLLYYLGKREGSEATEDRGMLLRLVVPETLQRDFLHHYHCSVEGAHQGVSRTFAKIKRFFYWRSMYRSVQEYVGSCTDCETGKGAPRIHGSSPGNVKATYPFQIIAMDHIPSLPRSHRGNTELLIWVDLFSGS